MVTNNDKVYVYMVNLENSIDKAGFSKSRLGTVASIETVKINGKEEGQYTIKTDDDKEWRITTNSITFKIATVEELIDTIKYSNVDENKKEEWLITINEF